MQLPTIDILICTIGNRINQIPNNLLPPTEGINYIISYQTDDKPTSYPQALLQRDDVKITTIEGRGLSANRNNAIKHATGDLLIISDDDASYSIQRLNTIRNIALKNPQADVLTFMVDTPLKTYLHSYPSNSFVYPARPKGFYYNSNEIVLRGRLKYPLFDTRFGLGSKNLQMGEEEVFIHDCYLKKMRIEFYPFLLQTIPNITTSSHYNNTPSLQQSKGAVLTLLHGPAIASLKFIKTAIKMRHNIKMSEHLKNMFQGMIYILKTKPLKQ